MSVQEENGSVAECVHNFLERNAAQRVHKGASELLETGGFEDRFNYFEPYAPKSDRRSILVSGSAVGTELLVARRYGFDYACGTEVQHQLAALAPKRLQDIDGCDTILYDGARLPFPDASFDVVASGHIIEHAADPRTYFNEHLRVLRPGGVFFLEFPDRNHSIELHTTAPGFEWMPGMMREFTYTYLESGCPQVSREHSESYSLILDTLNPIGIRDVLTLIQETPYPATLRHHYKPLPGFVRSVIIREAACDNSSAVLPKAPAFTRSFFDCLEEPLSWPKTDSRCNQVKLLLEPKNMAAAADQLAQALVFMLWCIGRFFALNNQIHEDLHYQIAPVFPGFRSAWRSDLTSEDNFIPGLFGSLLDSFADLNGPYWQTIVVAAFHNPCFRRALDRYYACWTEPDGGELRKQAQFSTWTEGIFDPL